jgi:hypothetical protein
MQGERFVVRRQRGAFRGKHEHMSLRCSPGRTLARPMKEEWKMRPYLGVLPRVLSARNSAFSAPRICTVDDCSAGKGFVFRATLQQVQR